MTKNQLQKTLQAISSFHVDNVVLWCRGETLKIGVNTKFIHIIKMPNNQTYFNISVNAQLFIKVLNTFNDDEFTLEHKGNQLILSQNSKTFKLNCENNEEELEGTYSSEHSTINAEKIFKWINKVSFACAKKETRPMLTGINFNDNRVVGCDAARLSCLYEKTVLSDITVPVKELCAVSTCLTGDYSIFTDKKRLYLYNTNEYYEIPVLNGDYPDIVKLLNTQHTKTLRTNKNELINAINSLNILGARALKLELSENKVILSSDSECGNASFQLCQDTSYSGDKMTIYFNGQFVLDGLKTLSHDTIDIHFNSELKPFFIEENEHFMLFVPIKN